MVDVTALVAKQTNGINYGVTTDDVVARLLSWDQAYGISTSDIEHDSVTVHFQSLPDDVRALADEIYEFCPDTVDQHFGCFVEMIDGMEEMGQELAAKVAELIEGIDLDDEDYGVQLLARSLERDKLVALWWD